MNCPTFSDQSFGYSLNVASIHILAVNSMKSFLLGVSWKNALAIDVTMFVSLLSNHKKKTSIMQRFGHVSERAVPSSLTHPLGTRSIRAIHISYVNIYVIMSPLSQKQSANLTPRPFSPLLKDLEKKSTHYLTIKTITTPIVAPNPPHSHPRLPYPV